MALSHADLVFLIVKGIGRYVTQLYEMGENYDENAAEDYLPEGMRTMLQGCVNRYRNERYLHAFDHYVDEEDRVNSLKKSMRSSINNMRRLLHMKFLRECTLHIMAAAILKQEGFAEAPDIAVDAIYRTCMKSKQHEALPLWGRVKSAI